MYYAFTQSGFDSGKVLEFNCSPVDAWFSVHWDTRILSECRILNAQAELKKVWHVEPLRWEDMKCMSLRVIKQLQLEELFDLKSIEKTVDLKFLPKGFNLEAPKGAVIRYRHPHHGCSIKLGPWGCVFAPGADGMRISARDECDILCRDAANIDSGVASRINVGKNSEVCCNYGSVVAAGIGSIVRFREISWERRSARTVCIQIDGKQYLPSVGYRLSQGQVIPA